MDCAILKLLNGDEIIAEVLKDEEDSYTISQPVQVHRNVSPINTEVIRCSYWLLFSDSSTIKIEKKANAAIATIIPAIIFPAFILIYHFLFL